jgi:hypothetical protein
MTKSHTVILANAGIHSITILIYTVILGLDPGIHIVVKLNNTGFLPTQE